MLAVGVGVLTQIHTTVDQSKTVLTIERRRLLGSSHYEEIAFHDVESVVARHIGLEEEYSEHGRLLVLADGSRRTLARHISPGRMDTVRDDIKTSLRH